MKKKSMSQAGAQLSLNHFKSTGVVDSVDSSNYNVTLVVIKGVCIAIAMVICLGCALGLIEVTNIIYEWTK